MITLHIDLTTESEGRAFDIDKMDDAIEHIEFDSIKKLLLHLIANLIEKESKVYILAYGSDEDGVVYVDHYTPNVIKNIETQARAMSDEQPIHYIFLFASDTYEKAYELAMDMKEQTGMVWKWQKEGDPTIDNKGIKITSNAN